MLSFLVAALTDSRLEAGVSLDDVAFRIREQAQARGHEIKIDKSFLSRLETGAAGWTPKIDDIVRGYAIACETTDTALWDAALRAYGREESDRAIQAAMRKGRERQRRQR